MNATEKLNQLFSNDEFIKANKDLDNMDAIYAAVLSYDSTITKDELSLYLTEVSKLMGKANDGELSEEDLADVAGGGGITFFTVISALGGCYKLGEGLGKFIYNLTHR